MEKQTKFKIKTMVTEEQYKEAKKIVEEYEQQLNILVVSNCTECGNVLINEETECDICTECFYKDRYKYDY